MTRTYRPAEDTQAVAHTIADAIITRLAEGKKVLWLVPGGSAIAVACLAARDIAAVPHGNLAVTLTDERYGPLGHSDSNWQQLEGAGFSLPEARLLSVLTGADRAQTVKAWEVLLRHELKAADFALGFFGMGADGHTAGILPGSPAVSSTAYAATYDGPDFARITMTPPAIARLDMAFVYAAGQNKWPALRRLNERHSIAEQPAQILKQVPELIIFTDYREGI
jgi:6-phosphogluconolactonase/glucosamine-6-phosphate isomerase/deaminase